MASTETTVSSLQRALNGLKVQVDSLTQDKNSAEKTETLQRHVYNLTSQNQILKQRIEQLESHFEINKTKSLQQTIEVLQTQVDSLSRENRRKNKKIAINFKNKIEEAEQKFNRNIAEIYELLNDRTLETVKKDSKINRDCQDQFLQGHKQSGVYNINPFGNETQVDVYCDMEKEGGGWTAIQKRVSGFVSFNRTWAEYKDGFGNPSDSYWIGNDVIHQLTKGRNSSLYVSITSYNGTALYELYQQFSVSHERNNYRLFLGGSATGTLGDSMLDTGSPYFDLSGMSFSTLDRDNDVSGGSCAVDFGGGGGWWYNRCKEAYLNGPWSSGDWTKPWYPVVRRGADVRETKMMIRRH
ncbi:microfibril-associated glycoprotein 4-like [Saccostrea cucullata]|uniref:microfibril-associated glycoprotein 4-like n=1 Tax=Saccostrea cuccullata TaxID=36930 RepID=UPI002ED5432C